MRIKYHTQRSIFDNYAEHQIGRELLSISCILDEHPEIYKIASKDLVRVCKATGREGLTVESVLRCAILKQYRQLSYEELAFHLEDSKSFESFARLNGKIPKKSSLQKTISLISADSWESINQLLLKHALIKQVEDGNKIRTDSTVTESHIHYPTDSSLLYDSVKTVCQLLKIAQGITKSNYPCRMRIAKKLWRSIPNKREQQRLNLYRKLIKITQEELSYLQQAKEEQSSHCGMSVMAWYAAVDYYEPLILKVIDQAKRRVLKGEKVPANEKVVSIFEPHADIISKGRRETQFGHKLNLTTGKSGLILDLVIEKGNPADSEKAIPMIKRQIEIYGEVPEKVSFDGGYASKQNLAEAIELGVKDVMFHKKRGLKIEDMVKSKWVYRQLKNFRAGIEANISWLKRSYGLDRCNWKGLKKFCSYVWSSVVAYNLVLIARATLVPG